MPLYQVSLRKAINTSGIAYKWSNRYFVQSPDVASALQSGINFWVLAEATFHNQLAFCYEVYANNTEDPPNTPGTVQSVPVGDQRGNRPGNASSVSILLPLWNVARIDFSVVASRPSRKFYRIPLLETDVTSAQLDPDISGAIIAGAALIATAGESRDVDNQLFTGSVSTPVLTSRRLGREAAFNVPAGPAFG